MLTKQDTKIIETISSQTATKAVTEGLIDFWENIIEPFFNKFHEENMQQHQEIVKEIVGMKKEIRSLDEETTEIKEYIKDHDKRIEILETTVSIKN